MNRRIDLTAPAPAASGAPLRGLRLIRGSDFAVVENGCGRLLHRVILLVRVPGARPRASARVLEIRLNDGGAKSELLATRVFDANRPWVFLTDDPQCREQARYVDEIAQLAQDFVERKLREEENGKQDRRKSK